jgi:hypothetical protein
MIREIRYYNELEVSCDAPGCTARTLMAGDTVKAAINEGVRQGWQPGQWPRWYCPACPVPPPSGEGTVVTQDKDGKVVIKP